MDIALHMLTFCRWKTTNGIVLAHILSTRIQIQKFLSTFLNACIMKILYIVPEEARHLWYAPVIYVHDSYFVFGGEYQTEYLGSQYFLATIGKLDSQRFWSEAGRMQRPRSMGALVFVDNTFLYFGGTGENYKTELSTEKCTLQDNFVTCKTQAPALSSRTETHVFPVSSYCKYTVTN